MGVAGSPLPVSTTASSAVLNSPQKSTSKPGSNARESTSHHTPTASSTSNDDNHRRTATGMQSEHGHSYGIDALHRIAPMAVHSGSSVATFFNGLFQTILAIGTLGASITFNYVVSNASSPDPSANNNAPRFDGPTVQLFLSISWLLFLLALAFASLGSTLLTFFRKHWERDWDGRHGRTSQVTVQWYSVLAAGVMGGLVIGAFVLLCLVVVAYSPVVGWIALGFTTFFGGIIAVAIANQVPWPCNWREPVGIDPVVRVEIKDPSEAHHHV